MTEIANLSQQPAAEEKEFLHSVTQQDSPQVDKDLNDSAVGLRTQIRRTLEMLGIHTVNGAFNLLESGVTTTNNFTVQGGDGTAEGGGRAAFKGIRCFLKSDTDWVNAGSTDADKSLLPQATAVGSATLTDATAKYEVGELVGRLLTPNVASAGGEQYPITGNTATTITVDTSGVGIPVDEVAVEGSFYRVETDTPSGADRADTVWLNVSIQTWGGNDDPTIGHNAGGIGFVGAMRAKVRHTIHVRGRGVTSLADYTAAEQEYTDAFGALHVVVKIAEIARSDGVPAILTADITNLLPQIDNLQTVQRRGVAYRGALSLLDSTPPFVTSIENQAILSPPDPPNAFDDYVASTYFTTADDVFFTAGAGTTERSVVAVGLPASADDFYINTWLEINLTGTADGPFAVVLVTDFVSGTSTFSLAENVRGLAPGATFKIVGDNLTQACAKLDRALRRMNVDASETVLSPPVVPGIDPTALLISRGAANLGDMLGETPRWPFASGFAGTPYPNWNFLAGSVTVHPNPGYIFNRSFDNKYHNILIALDDTVKAIGVLLGLNTDLGATVGTPIVTTHTFGRDYAFASPAIFTDVVEDIDEAVERLAATKMGETVENGVAGAPLAPAWAQPFTINTLPATADHHTAIEAIQAKIGDLDDLPGSLSTIMEAIAALSSGRIVRAASVSGSHVTGLFGSPGAISVNGSTQSTKVPIVLDPGSSSAILTRLQIVMSIQTKSATQHGNAEAYGLLRADFDGLYQAVTHGWSWAWATGGTNTRDNMIGRFDHFGGDIIGGSTEWPVVDAPGTLHTSLAWGIPSGPITGPLSLTPSGSLGTSAFTNGGFPTVLAPLTEYIFQGSIIAEWIDF